MCRGRPCSFKGGGGGGGILFKKKGGGGGGEVQPAICIGNLLKKAFPPPPLPVSPPDVLHKKLELHEAHVPRANNTIKCTCSRVDL